MPARLTRWHPACCPSRSEKQPRRCRSSWTGARSTVSPCGGARSAIPTTPKAAPPRPARNVPTPEAVRALIPRFSGLIEQVPPRFSAVKIGGERAYDLARDGEVVELAARPIEIHHIELVDDARPRSQRARRRVRQGDLCARAGPRHGPRARLLRTCDSAAPHRGRPVHRADRHRSGSIAAHGAARR